MLVELSWVILNPNLTNPKTAGPHPRRSVFYHLLWWGYGDARFRSDWFLRRLHVKSAVSMPVRYVPCPYSILQCSVVRAAKLWKNLQVTMRWCANLRRRRRATPAQHCFPQFTRCHTRTPQGRILPKDVTNFLVTIVTRLAVTVTFDLRYWLIRLFMRTRDFANDVMYR